MWFLCEILKSPSVSLKTHRLHFAYQCCLQSHCFSLKHTFLKLNERVPVIYAALFFMHATSKQAGSHPKSNLSGRGHFWLQNHPQRSRIIQGNWSRSHCLEARNYPVSRSCLYNVGGVWVLMARELALWSRDNPAFLESDSTQSPTRVKGLAVTSLLNNFFSVLFGR